ncbi:MAG TPA: hypothetical protein VGX95_01625 [Xanthobacteraceae bacterium]|nr:hypothetical protein [Xanthobacteraceae bacterium]
MSKYNRRSSWHKESSTFRRLLSSQHVSELRLIFFVSLASVLLVAGLALFFQFQPDLKKFFENHPNLDLKTWDGTVKFMVAIIAVAGVAVVAWAYKAGSKQIRLILFFTLWIVVLVAAFVVCLNLVPSSATDAATGGANGDAKGGVNVGIFNIGAIALAGATIMSWAYQTGSKRLGVVDLFACEIATLCRVGTVVKFFPNMLTQYNSIGSAPKQPVPSEHPAQALRFSSEENYFPVFETNSRDLQILEADVVNNVTAFYTYMKATRDMLRKLGDLRLSGVPADEERKAVINVIYMVFLAYESARRAIDYLIEFEPTHAEDTIVLLFTELPAFRFLRAIYAPEGKFPDEIRAQRLQLRFAEYQEFIPALCREVGKRAHRKEWQKASSMVDGLTRAFAAVQAEATKQPASIAPADQPSPAAKAA